MALRGRRCPSPGPGRPAESRARTTKEGRRRGRTAAFLPLAKFFLERLVGQLAWVDAEPLLEHLRVLLVVDLVGKLSEGFLNVLVLALLPKQIDDLLLVELHRRLYLLPRAGDSRPGLIVSLSISCPRSF